MKHKKNTALDCAIVRDLLPLYHDGVVSSETKQAVSAHLDTCKPCAGEYEALCRELPLDGSNPTTREQFDRMMRRKKRRQRIVTAFTALMVSAALLIAGWVFCVELHLVDFSDEIEVLRAYRFETDEGNKLFVMYTMPFYSPYSSDIDVKNGDTLVLRLKKPLVSQTILGEPEMDFWVYDYGWETGDDGILYQDFDTVKFGDQVIWSREENGDDIIPDYVYAFDAVNGGLREGVASISYSHVDEEITANYADGRSITWDFDGNVIDPAD